MSVLFVVFLIDWFLRVYAGSLPDRNSGPSGGWRSECNSFEFNYLRQRRPPPLNPGKTSLFAPQNEVSPSKTEVYPGNSDYKNDFFLGENEVYPLKSSLQTEVYPGESRSGREALVEPHNVHGPAPDTGQLQAPRLLKTLKNNF